MISEGVKISHYKVLHSVGSGGMGEVYLAEDLNLERKVALKVLLPDFANDNERVRRFEQEAKSASALNHPNILTVFEVGAFENTRYIATEFVRGKTLRDRMAGGQMDLAEMFSVTLQVTAALCAAHEAGIVHRDIKPENIMIREDGLVKVLDFGLAKLVSTSADSAETTLHQINTHPGMLIGTAAYMSPEQARGQKLDPRSDIFSFGIVMFELFGGKRPFEGEGHLDVISSILRDQPPTLREVSPDMPRQLERIITKSLRKDRDNRYQHIKDLQIDLEDLRDELKSENKLDHRSGTSQIKTVATGNGAVKTTLTESISRTRRFTILHVLMIAAAAVVLVGAAWYVRAKMYPAAPVPGSYKTTEIASWNSAPGELSNKASFSPDAKLIAFSSTKSGTKNIWVTQVTSTNAIQITNDNYSNIEPIWSPTGDEIAYFSDRGNADTTGIWRISALGGGTPGLVGSLLARSAELRRWTPSGKVYYQMEGELYAIDVSSGASQKVTSLDRPDIFWLDVSDDEKSLAYASVKDGVWQIMISDISGQHARQIATGQGEISVDMVWLSEKNKVFYSAAVDGVQQVFVVDSGSEKSYRLTASDTDISVMDVSPTGDSLIIGSAKEESNLWRATLSDSQESPLARDLNAKLWPSVSPDNQKVAFQSVKNLNGGTKIWDGDIVFKNLASRNESEKPTLVAKRAVYPSWSPDGSYIGFMRKDPDKTELFATNSNGGGEKRLATGGIAAIGYSTSPYNYIQTKAFSWSPDSTSIAYISTRNGASNLWLAGLRDNSDTVITKNVDPELSVVCPIWSSDGKRLAYSTERRDNGKSVRGLEVLDVATGEVNKVMETTDPMRLIGSTSDESALIIAVSEINSGLPPVTNLKRVAIAGGVQSSIADLKNIYFYNILLSDDRKFIAYAARNDSKDDIWVLPSTGGVARKVTSNNDSSLYYSRLAWLHDGSAIVFGKQTRYSLLSIITGMN